jgi:Tfp pilus assembly protein PilO
MAIYSDAYYKSFDFYRYLNASMKQNSKRLVSIVVALLFVIVALVLFFDLLQPEYTNLEALKGQALGEQNFLTAETKAVTQAQQLISQYQSEGQGEQDAALAMPTGADIAGALAQAYGLAQSNGVAIQTISLSTPTLQAQTQPQVSADGTAPTLTQIVKPLGSILLQIQAVGSYESLASFVAGLGTNIRIFNIKSLSVQPVQSSGTVGKNVAPVTQDLFTYNIGVAVYYQTP